MRERVGRGSRGRLRRGHGDLGGTLLRPLDQHGRDVLCCRWVAARPESPLVRIAAVGLAPAPHKQSGQILFCNGMQATMGLKLTKAHNLGGPAWEVRSAQPVSLQPHALPAPTQD